MEIIFPDVPEYHFILKGLCSDKFPSYPKFRCEPVSEFDEKIDSDVAFVPSPIAIMNSHDYLFLRAGNIFSYFSGPQIFSDRTDHTELFVDQRDFVSEYYAKIFLEGVEVRRGEGSPMIMEPRIAMMSDRAGLPKIDLYGRWSSVAKDLPFPLYSAMIKKSIGELRGIVEEAIHASVRYGLTNSSDTIKEIAMMYGVENVEMLKRVMFQFINKNTLSMSDEEMESLRVLNEEMENRCYPVSHLEF